MSLKNNAPAATRRGEITVEIGGQPRTFKFGMNALGAYSELRPSQAVESLLSAMQTNPIRFFVDMAYCGLQQRAADNALPEGFAPETVGDWIDEMPQADWNKVRDVMTAALMPGKPTTEAPTMPA